MSRSRAWARARWRLRAVPGMLVTRDWVIAVAFTLGMASLSAAFGILPDFAVEGWSGNPRLPWLAGSAAAAVVTLGAGVAMWWLRNALLHRRGPAYLIEESAPGWDPEDKRAFTAAVRSQFSAVREVPGPARLRGEPAWTFDAPGSERWDERLTDLVHAFRALQVNDDPSTDISLFMWAPWPVALGFGLRTVGRLRGLRLRVRQRPSFGRAGGAQPAGFAAPGIAFRDAGAPLSGTVSKRRYRVRLSAEPAGRPGSVTVLLVRTSDRPYGPLPGGWLPAVTVRDGAGLGLPRRATVAVREWHYRPPRGLVPWNEYESVATEVAGWIRDRARDAGPDATVLLGMLVPQEIGLGVGVVAARTPGWPHRLWPLVYDPESRSLVTVALNLGDGRDAALAGGGTGG